MLSQLFGSAVQDWTKKNGDGMKLFLFLNEDNSIFKHTHVLPMLSVVKDEILNRHEFLSLCFFFPEGWNLDFAHQCSPCYGQMFLLFFLPAVGVVGHWTSKKRELTSLTWISPTGKHLGEVLQPKPVPVRLSSPWQEISWFLQAATWRLPDWSEHPAIRKDLGVVSHHLYGKLICDFYLLFFFIWSNITSS